ncbi:hypothetical protein HPB52_006352 [Rhipicephalus sanguineus]|uniref:Uncharacterized protein n=1 Tax=Rhipicephalus sanguineus TaxID=34632 RepID=A0A9D4SWJ5_RHISA|nr:hypothetical protein HPB52_006352 [Rhipicephalus sanguineus]
MAHLRVRTQGVKILQARMLGKSKTAVITFDGKVVSRFVNYYGGTSLETALDAASFAGGHNSGSKANLGPSCRSLQLLQLGPKFALEPLLCPPAKLAASRAVSRLVPEEERARFLRAARLRCSGTIGTQSSKEGADPSSAARH